MVVVMVWARKLTVGAGELNVLKLEAALLSAVMAIVSDCFCCFRRD